MLQKAARTLYPALMRATKLPGAVGSAACCSLILGAGWLAAQSIPAGREQPGLVPAIVTNMAQFRQLAAEAPSVSYPIRVEGNVWWTRPTQGRLVLQDASGAEELEMDLEGQAVHSGERVRLKGDGSIIKRGAAFLIGVKGPVVDNDGVHGMVEKSGSVYLAKGRHPLRVDWFNGTGRFGLKLEYEGPGFPRQKLPDSALLRAQAGTDSSVSNLVNGIDCRCYEGTWDSLPDFKLLLPVKTSTQANLDLKGRTRDQHVGLQFTGYLEVPRDGLSHLLS